MSQHLILAPFWEGSRRTSQGQNRTREIRPSGIAGGPMETWTTGAGLRPVGKPPDLPPDPNVVARHSSIPTLLTFSSALLPNGWKSPVDRTTFVAH